MVVLELIMCLGDLPFDAVVMSDSGWECDPTDIGGIWYSKEDNMVILTQDDEAPQYLHFDTNKYINILHNKEVSNETNNKTKK